MSNVAITTEDELKQAIAELEEQLTETPDARAERLRRLNALHTRVGTLKDQLEHRNFLHRKLASVSSMKAGIENLKRLIDLSETNAQKALDTYVAAVDARAPHTQGYFAPIEYERSVEAASREYAAARVHVIRHKANLVKSEELLRQAEGIASQLKGKE